MTNRERQRSLDRKKWNESREQMEDMSGKMYYCECCEKQGLSLNYPFDLTCTATQEDREEQCLCATAFNRLQRR